MTDDFHHRRGQAHGRETAISETDNKYGRLCRSLAFAILKNCEDMEECLNDTYLSVWNDIPPTRPNNFMAYICKIVRNLSLKRVDYNKAMKRNEDLNTFLSENIGFSIPSQTSPKGIHSPKARSKTCCITQESN